MPEIQAVLAFIAEDFELRDCPQQACIAPTRYDRVVAVSLHAATRLSFFDVEPTIECNPVGFRVASACQGCPNLGNLNRQISRGDLRYNRSISGGSANGLARALDGLIRIPGNSDILEARGSTASIAACYVQDSITKCAFQDLGNCVSVFDVGVRRPLGAVSGEKVVPE